MASVPASQPVAPGLTNLILPKVALAAVSSIIGLIVVIVLGAVLSWGQIEMAIDVTKIAGILAPVAFAAAVVERAIQILVSPWRDGEAALLKAAIGEVRARPVDPNNAVRDKTDLDNAVKALVLYKAQTQRIAFAVGFITAAFLSVSGVHALGGFVNANVLATLSEAQKRLFIGADVGLTALLLAGGADGVHSIANSITAFFNATASKSSNP